VACKQGKVQCSWTGGFVQRQAKFQLSIYPRDTASLVPTRPSPPTLQIHISAPVKGIVCRN